MRLAQFTRVTAALGLAPDSLVDAYDPAARAWGTQPANAVQRLSPFPVAPTSTTGAVASRRPLLFRARRSLLEGLGDAECPGLEHELRAQHAPLDTLTTFSAFTTSTSSDLPGAGGSASTGPGAGAGAGSGGMGGAAKGEDALAQIGAILSTHLESLQWIDGAVREVEGRVGDVEKRLRETSMGLGGSGGSNPGYASTAARPRGFGMR